jgi:hypothetical protein
MIIELRNIHAKWKLLIENTCMVLANENETVWIGMGLGECGCFTNKGENKLYGRRRHCEANVTGDRVHESNNCPNRPL